MRVTPSLGMQLSSAGKKKVLLVRRSETKQLRRQQVPTPALTQGETHCAKQGRLNKLWRAQKNLALDSVL